MGRSRVTVSNLLRLLELGDEVRGLVEKRELEMGHARTTGPSRCANSRLRWLCLWPRKGLSVRETEALVRRMLDHASAGKEPSERAEGSQCAQAPAGSHRSTGRQGRRAAQRQRQRAKSVISYNSLDELDGILTHIS